MRPIVASLALFIAISAAFATSASGQSHQHTGAPPKNLGSVSFENSCSPAVQEPFGRAMAMLHSFWYDEAARQFQEVTVKEPDCAMAWWGVAISQWQPLWEVRGPGRDALGKGRHAIDRGLAVTTITPREREYLTAVAQFYTDVDRVDHLDRVAAYENAMAQLQTKYPQDSEARVLYALSLLASAAARPPDKTYARQKKASELLEPVFRAQPDHPGVAHYIIHANDYPPLASHALEAARRYAKIAPDSPHALHMPSHVFTRLGLWDESINSNRAVVEAARKHGVTGEELHGRDYWVFAHLQRGEDQLAREVIDTKPPLSSVAKESPSFFAGLYATAAMPARYAVERRQWAEAARLPDPAGFPGGRYVWADAATYFARSLGAARTGDVEHATRDLDKLQAARETLLENKEDYWAGQVDVQHRAAQAWVAFADGRREEALAFAREAADLEDRADKHPVTPGRIVAARDLLGQMLLEMNRPADAFVEFTKVLQAEPNRFGALYGAARSAELSGQGVRARELYQQLVKVAPQSRRSEVQHARDVLAKKTSEPIGTSLAR